MQTGSLKIVSIIVCGFFLLAGQAYAGDGADIKIVSNDRERTASLHILLPENLSLQNAVLAVERPDGVTLKYALEALDGNWGSSGHREWVIPIVYLANGPETDSIFTMNGPYSMRLDGPDHSAVATQDIDYQFPECDFTYQAIDHWDAMLFAHYPALKNTLARKTRFGRAYTPKSGPLEGMDIEISVCDYTSITFEHTSIKPSTLQETLEAAITLISTLDPDFKPQHGEAILAAALEHNSYLPAETSNMLSNVSLWFEENSANSLSFTLTAKGY